MINFIWSCMVLSLKAALGGFFWGIGIFILICIIGFIFYIFDKKIG